MKFIIWGAGKLGKLIISILGQDKIAAIVDNKIELQNTTYEGIPIVDHDQNMEFYKQWPILVTPKKHEDEIIQQLYENGIYWVFSFSRNREAIVAFMLQVSAEDIMKCFQAVNTAYIYGYSILSFLLYDFLEKYNIKCKLVLPSNLNHKAIEHTQENLGMSLETVERVNSQKVFLTCNINDADREIFIENDCIIEKIYDLGRRDIYYNAKLEKFRNIHKGKRCFIVATGPSLRVEDLNTLYENREICISVNGIFKIFKDTLWRPDYYMISDRLGMISWKEDILLMDVKEKFITDTAWLFGDGISDSIYKWHLQTSEGETPEFSDDFARRSYVGYTIIYDGALQLAAYMGFQEIYLLGTDCCHYEDPKKQHFVEDYSDERSHVYPDLWAVSYQSAKQYADQHGIKIYNATRGGQLEVFESVGFDSLFQI